MIKKAFIKLANEQNEYFNVKNFWVMEIAKLAVQPVKVLHEWSMHRCFCDEKFILTYQQQIKKLSLRFHRKAVLWYQ